MRDSKIERVRGVNDVLPTTRRINRVIEDKLQKCFDTYGYVPIETPVIEYTDLYLRKSGEEIISRLYDFEYRNRRLSLRPEMTASVIRAYVDGMQDMALPVRLCFNGPVFRYEKPQRARQRQFTQMGIELIGAGGPMADAEIIHVAARALDMLGVTRYRIVLGHVGILAEFLKGLQLPYHIQSLLLGSMESLRKYGKQSVIDRLIEVFGSAIFNDSEFHHPGSTSTSDEQIGHEPAINTLLTVLQGMEQRDARSAIFDFLQNMNIDLGGSRSPDEIIDRLLMKMKRQDQIQHVHHAMRFMEEMGQLTGKPAEVLASAEKVLAAYEISRQPLDQLQEIVTALEYYRSVPDSLQLDLGLSRGLQYYTGMVFELHHDAMEQDSQLCGGGRYDDLVAALGGRHSTPAAGFSYGIERVRFALEIEGAGIAPHGGNIDVLIVPVSSSEFEYAVNVAERLRSVALRVELDVRGRSVKSNLHYANKQVIPFVLILGSNEAKFSQVVLKDMHSRQDLTIDVQDAADQLLRMRDSNA